MNFIRSAAQRSMLEYTPAPYRRAPGVRQTTWACCALFNQHGAQVAEVTNRLGIEIADRLVQAFNRAEGTPIEELERDVVRQFEVVDWRHYPDSFHIHDMLSPPDEQGSRLVLTIAASGWYGMDEGTARRICAVMNRLVAEQAELT